MAARALPSLSHMAGPLFREPLAASPAVLRLLRAVPLGRDPRAPRPIRRRPSSAANAQLLLVGCNGIPSRCYEPLLWRIRDLGDFSTEPFEVSGLAGEDWNRAVDGVVKAALRARLRAEDAGGAPVVGFGHSLGGALMYAAAARSEGAFDHVVLFDAPMFHPYKRCAMLAMQRLGLMDLVPLVASAGRRRGAFASHEDFAEYVLQRDLYQSFHPEVIDAILADGAVEGDEDAGDASLEVRFGFSPEAEAQYYRSTPTDLHRGLGAWVGQYEAAGCHGTFVYSREHQVIHPMDVAYLRKTLRGPGGAALDFQACAGDHFLPLQDPDGVAEMVVKVVEQFFDAARPDDDEPRAA